MQKKFWPETDDGGGLELTFAEVSKQMGVYDVLVPQTTGKQR
jgi:hypothetical protein